MRSCGCDSLNSGCSQTRSSTVALVGNRKDTRHFATDRSEIVDFAKNDRFFLDRINKLEDMTCWGARQLYIANYCSWKKCACLMFEQE